MTDDLNGQLERLINQRTAGRIHRLRVDTVEGRVIVHGITRSYHARQLALAAVQEVLQATRSHQSGCVELKVEVADSRLGY